MEPRFLLAPSVMVWSERCHRGLARCLVAGQGPPQLAASSFLSEPPFDHRPESSSASRFIAAQAGFFHPEPIG
jgi:hypothetical protein